MPAVPTHPLPPPPQEASLAATHGTAEHIQRNGVPVAQRVAKVASAVAKPDGLRKEEAVEQLYPDLEPEKCNSAFHSNLYRVRKALYQESVVKRDGAYVLNPEGEFEWDVAEF